MANKRGGQAPQELQRPVKPAARLFFINGDLCRLTHVVPSANMVYFHNIVHGTDHTMLYTDYKKHRKRAYSVAATARILNRGTAQIARYINRGLIKPPTGDTIGGERSFGRNSYFSEDDLFDIREAMTTVHRGQPRKDGRITPSRVLTEQQLRARMGDALTLYTRTEDGRFLPVWAEQTY